MSRPTPDPLTGLYTRIPTSLAANLDRVAATTGRAKQQIVTEIFERAFTTDVNPPTKTTEVADVLTLDEVATLLRVESDDVLESIEVGGLPGRRVGPGWRFSRAALEAWLNQPEPRNDRAVGFTASADPKSRIRSSK
jgi:excisionase family DNA binding protein